MYSIANSFGDFRCPTEKLYLDWFISLMVAGNMLGFVVLSSFGSWLGKKTVIVGGMIACTSGILLAVIQISL